MRDPAEDIKHLIMFSGGICSYAAAKRVVERHGADGVVLLFADTLIEDPTLYEFIEEASNLLNLPLVKIADGRTPFEVCRDVKFLANSRIDPCSRILKRDLLNQWREDNCDKNVITHFGLDWNEPHRLKKVQERHAPWVVKAYMTERPIVTKEKMLEDAKLDGLTPCSLYDHGFAHANCGGGCVKSGIAQFTKLKQIYPERFEVWKNEENKMRELLDSDVAILKDRRNGQNKPLTLEALEKRLQTGQMTFDELCDWGGCGCAVD